MPVNFIDLRLNEDGKTKPNEENRNLWLMSHYYFTIENNFYFKYEEVI